MTLEKNAKRFLDHLTTALNPDTQTEIENWIKDECTIKGNIHDKLGIFLEMQKIKIENSEIDAIDKNLSFVSMQLAVAIQKIKNYLATTTYLLAPDRFKRAQEVLSGLNTIFLNIKKNYEQPQDKDHLISNTLRIANDVALLLTTANSATSTENFAFGYGLKRTLQNCTYAFLWLLQAPTKNSDNRTQFSDYMNEYWFDIKDIRNDRALNITINRVFPSALYDLYHTIVLLENRYKAINNDGAINPVPNHYEEVLGIRETLEVIMSYQLFDPSSKEKTDTVNLVVSAVKTLTNNLTETRDGKILGNQIKEFEKKFAPTFNEDEENIFEDNGSDIIMKPTVNYSSTN